MRALVPTFLIASLFGVAACGSSQLPAYDGPEVTQIYVSKERRKLYLLHDTDVLKEYKIHLGFQPEGHKRVSGDGRTPEGLYMIDRRNANSRYHLSLGISYPNRKDVEVAKAAGMDPGGDIFIHGESARGPSGRDWTAGCIAVKDREIEEIYTMVREGTPIYIEP